MYLCIAHGTRRPESLRVSVYEPRGLAITTAKDGSRCLLHVLLQRTDVARIARSARRSM